MVYGFETTFDLGEIWATTKHQWVIACSLDASTAHSWSPAADLNLIDGRGIHVTPIRYGNDDSIDVEAVKQKETFVVLKPM